MTSARWQLRRHLHAERRRIVLAALAMSGRAAVLVLLPWPLKFVVNCVILGKPVPEWLGDLLPGVLAPRIELLHVLGAAMLAMAACEAALDYVGNRLFLQAGQRTVFALRHDMFNHLVSLPLAFHRQRRGGELMSRLSEDVGRVQDVVVVAGTALLPHVLTLGGIVVVMLVIDWRYALLAMAFLPALGFVSRHWATRLRGQLRGVRARDGELWAMAQEVLAALPLVQSSGRERHESRRFAGRALRSLRMGLAASRTQAQFAPLINVLIGTSAAVVTWYGALRALAGTLTPGDLLLFLAYLRAVVTPARQIAKAAPMLGRAAVALERIREIFAERPTVIDPPHAVAPARCAGRLEFRAVGFAHTPGEPTLTDISFRLEPGRMVALVGPSGAGKSTLASLAARLVDPGSGQVLLDGTDLHRLPLGFVRRNIALLLQDAPLLHGTVWANIAYGRPGADRADAIRAASAAGVDEIIRALPGGYDHPVAERGAALSGGQRQCIAIARATLADARVVLLDEPSSSLDAGTEQAVAAALARLTARRATLIIAHRLATIRNADLILVIERGRIVQSGTHVSLRQQGGLYCRLIAAQGHHAPEPAMAAAPAE